MTENPGAPRTDELARNVALHAVAGAVASFGYDAYGMGEDADPMAVADHYLKTTESVTWERDVNAAGVPVRRYVLRGTWEVDPAPPANVLGATEEGGTPYELPPGSGYRHPYISER